MRVRREEVQCVDRMHHSGVPASRAGEKRRVSAHETKPPAVRASDDVDRAERTQDPDVRRRGGGDRKNHRERDGQSLDGHVRSPSSIRLPGSPTASRKPYRSYYDYIALRYLNKRSADTPSGQQSIWRADRPAVVSAVPSSGALGNNCRMPSPAAMKNSTSRDELIEALMTASRAMVAIAGRSLADVDPDVTLPQSRALVVLASRGPQRIIDIAADLGVAPSTATRMCDRLVRKGLARRSRTAADRREVRLSLTPVGRDLVRNVTRRRRDELGGIVDAIPTDTHRHVAAALQALNDAAGEPPERDWWLGPLDPDA